jgi:LAO/AO transport system kinase
MDVRPRFRPVELREPECQHRLEIDECAVGIRPVALADRVNVGDLENSGLDRLDVVAEARRRYDDRRVRGARHLDLVLADADRLDDHHVEAGGTVAPAWRAPVIATSSTRDEGVAQLLAAIDSHREALERSGDIAERRAAIAERRLLTAGEAILREQFARHRDGRLSSLLAQLRTRTLSPRSAARMLLLDMNIGGEA